MRGAFDDGGVGDVVTRITERVGTEERPKFGGEVKDETGIKKSRRL